MTIEKLLSRTIKQGECLIWQGAKRNTGYGCAKFNKKLVDTHRISYILHFGEIPKGMCICHKCDVRDCINPEHLFLGSYSDNTKDAINKGRMKIPKGLGYSKGHTPTNKSISYEKAKLIKDKIIAKNYIKLKDLSIEFNVSYQLIRDIKAGRSYVNV